MQLDDVSQISIAEQENSNCFIATNRSQPKIRHIERRDEYVIIKTEPLKMGSAKPQAMGASCIWCERMNVSPIVS